MGKGNAATINLPPDSGSQHALASQHKFNTRACQFTRYIMDHTGLFTSEAIFKQLNSGQICMLRQPKIVLIINSFSAAHK